MSNILKMELQQSILALKEQGWRNRRIARELGIDPRTVKRYVDSKCTNTQTGKSGPPSQCEGLAEEIKSAYENGLSIERIHQDLVCEHGFTGSYHSVYRFVQASGFDTQKRVYRMECEPGQEAQIDYGTLYLPIGDGRKKKKVHVLVVTLSHSRKAYVEAVLHQDSERFLRCLENAFRHFGGVPERLCPDNLAAAVKKADWYEPQINPKLRSFAAHYGTVIMPARPYQPTDKGKVEAGVKYVKNNALKGKAFESLAKVNEHLRWWTQNVADKRIHGTTKRQVDTHFEQSEKATLKALPGALFPSFSEGKRQVHRDSYIEVSGAYYEVPAQHIGKQVWARWDAAMVRIFDHKLELLRSHVRLERGQFSQVLGVGGCRGSVEQSIRYFRGKLIPLGEHTLCWADTVIASDEHIALRRLQGLLSLRKHYSHKQINEAARKACIHGQYTLKELKQWLHNPHSQETFCFLEKHELIRSPKTYDTLADTSGLFN